MIISKNITQNLIVRIWNFRRNLKNNNITFSGSGKFKIDKDFEEIDYFIEKNKNKISFNTNLNVKNTKFKIDNINYKKKDKSKMNLQINGEIKNNKNLNINRFIINEENNNIKIKNLLPINLLEK